MKKLTILIAMLIPKNYCPMDKKHYSKDHGLTISLVMTATQKRFTVYKKTDLEIYPRHKECRRTQNFNKTSKLQIIRDN